MLAIRSIISALPFALFAFAAPAPPPASSVITNATANDADDIGLSGKSVAIGGDGRSRIIFYNDSKRGGQGLDWGQQGHCWDFKDSSLAPFNDAISSIYPQDDGVVWTLWADYKCKGSSIQVTKPGIDDLATVGFNDRISAFSWVLR
ncbi:hypothetical protein B0H67DRAFT_646084 [Lasiosphaeris hirsuta]|uniref:Uncharacterized protein n=1 Tax=Lasiosphaeris hirsuta TaxID=260670 RepID=A0AA40DNY5_9PEZI|nr:hypothetical protein B0H67DRAFT_646084 [Lasiosphaeris hirsuta]